VFKKHLNAKSFSILYGQNRQLTRLI